MFRVWGLGFRVWGLRIRVRGLEFRFWSLGSCLQRLGAGGANVAAI